MKFYHLFAAFAAAAFACTGAFAQTPGTATNHAFLLGKGAGNQGYTSLLCTSAQLAVGQAAADPICKTITGDVTISAAGVTAIGATVVHSSMLNADVFSTAHSWSATQSFPNNSLTLAEFPTIGASTVIGSVAGGTPVALTQAQITALINAATASLSGALPAWPNNTTTYFRGDGTYATHNFASLGGQATLAQFPSGVSDTALGYWGSTAASALPINNCTGALTYSTTTHTFGCNASAGTGTVTSITQGTGLTFSTTPCTTTCTISLTTPVAAANGGAGTITGALKGNGAGVVSQAATSDLSDVVVPTAWTPSDQSGAALTFTTVTALYTRIGKHVTAQFRLTFPSTASGATAAIGGLPVASSSSGAIFSSGSCISNIGSGGFILGVSMVSNTSVLNFNSTATNPLPNSVFTSITLTCNISYISN